MLRVIIVYLIIIFISIIVGLSIRLNHTENSNIDLNKETTTESMKCKGGICPPPEGWEDGSKKR